jgi:hypothetical protein
MENQKNKLSDLFSRMDDAVTKIKINNALEMLKNGDSEELARKLRRMDMDEMLEKLNDFDKSKLKNMKIDTEELKEKISGQDLEKLKTMLGNRGDEIVNKIMDLLK